MKSIVDLLQEGFSKFSQIALLDLYSASIHEERQLLLETGEVLDADFIANEGRHFSVWKGYLLL